MSLTDALLLDPAPFEVWVSLRDQKGSGTLNDPFGVIAGSATNFDTLMNQIMTAFPDGTTVHLGPGIFTTAGYSDAQPSAGWQIKPKIRIIGSGRDITILKLSVSNPASPQQFFAIGHDLATGARDFCEIADLSIDANASALGANVAAGAVRLMGNHVRVRSIKVKNWGTVNTTKPCFVVAVITAYPASDIEVTNAGIEDCIATDPVAAATSAPITVFHAGGKEDASANKEGYGKVPFIRNCFVDCGILTDPLAPNIRALSIGWCRGGVVEGNQIHNVKIGGPYQDKATSRDVVVRNNIYKNVVNGPLWNLGFVNSSVGTATLAKSGNVITATTSVAHFFKTGDRVKITESTDDFSGIYVITGVPATDQFTINSPLSKTPGSATAVQKVFGVSNLLVERNAIELAPLTAGMPLAIRIGDNGISPQAPDYAHTEVVVRDNEVRYLNRQFESNYTGQGIHVEGVKNAIVRDNMVECAPVNPLKEFRCGTAVFFNNKTPSGALIQGFDSDTSAKYGELETESEDALVLALI